MNSIKTLLQQQKKLITLFILTIVLPTVAMSIFGIRMIRNEKYRHEQNILDEQQNGMMLLKRQFSEQLLQSIRYLSCFGTGNLFSRCCNLSLMC